MDTFIRYFKESIDVDINEEIGVNTIYKDLNHWNSMQALVTISIIDEYYDVIISAEDFKKSSTLQELFSIVQSKL